MVQVKREFEFDGQNRQNAALILKQFNNNNKINNNKIIKRILTSNLRSLPLIIW